MKEKEIMGNTVTHERLTQLLHYDPATGVFTRRVSVWGAATKGRIFGSDHTAGYLEGTIDGKRYYLHRLAYFYMNGTWPVGMIDHINRDRRDNRIENLRDVTPQGNTTNSSIKSTNKTGVKGVHICKRSQKYIAQITVDYKCIHLGSFDLLENAIAARRKAEMRISDLVFGALDPQINKHLEVDKHRVAPHKKKTSKFKGVSRHHTGKWSAKIMFNNQKKWIGLFDSEDEASRAYQRCKKELTGGSNG